MAGKTGALAEARTWGVFLAWCDWRKTSRDAEAPRWAHGRVFEALLGSGSWHVECRFVPAIAVDESWDVFIIIIVV